MVRRVIAYVVVLLLCIVPAIFVNSLYGWLPSLFVLALVALSLLYTLLLKRSFSYGEAMAVGSVTRGEKAAFQVRLKNRGALIFPSVRARFYIRDLFGDDSFLTDAHYTISPHEERRFEFHITFGHIGTYTIGLTSVTIDDLLGLFHLTYTNDETIPVHVKPVRYDAGELDIQNGNGIATARTVTLSTMDNQDYSSVRDYVWGDPIKNIHWKLSAHSTRFLVKKYENFSDNGVSVYIDLSAPHWERDALLQVYDALVESAYSVACDALEMGQDVQLIFGSAGLIRKVSPQTVEDAEEAMEQLPVISLTETTTASELLRSSEGRSADLDNVMVFTSNLNADLMYELEAVKQKRRNPQLFYVIPPGSGVDQLGQSQEVFKFLEGRGITYYVVESAQKLKDLVSVEP